MKKQAFRRQLVQLLTTIALGAVACSTPDTSGRNRAIEAALNQALQALEIPTGPELRITGDVRVSLKKAESAGLVELRHPSWMEAGLIEVLATPKLIGIAINPDAAWTAKNSQDYVGGETGDVTEFRVRVRVMQAKMDKVLTDEEYKGPLAAPGEKHRLVLGTFRNSPSAAAAVVGRDFTSQEESLLRFRCVVKYSEFKKEWSVAALDVGSIDPEQWYTSNVR